MSQLARNIRVSFVMVAATMVTIAANGATGLAWRAFEVQTVANGRERRAVPPVDVSRDDADLGALKAALLEAVRQRSLSRLVDSLADEVQFDFDAPVSTAQARQVLERWDEPERRALWRDLGDALALGLARDEHGDAWAPYAYLSPPCGRPRCAVITGAQVAVRREPSAAAPVVAVVSYETVELFYPDLVDEPATTIDGHQYGWRPIGTLSGARGFVSEKYVFTPQARRFWFKRTAHGWKLYGIAGPGD